MVYLLCVLGYLLTQTQKAKAQAVIYPVRVLGQITSCQGAESVNEEYEYFAMSGYNLTGQVNIIASSGFVVSVDKNAVFKGSISITPKKGAIIDTIYVRLSSTAPPGSVNGAVTISSAGVAPQIVTVNGTVLSEPTVDPEPNITVLNGTTLPALHFQGTGGNMYSWSNNTPNIGLAASGIDSLPTFRVLSNSNTTVTATITVTPVLAGTAYVTNSGSGTISVINTLTNTVDTTIASGGKGPASETLSPDGTKLYVLNFNSQTISVTNTITNKFINEFSLPSASLFPYQIALNHDGTQIYVINFGSGNFSVLDAQTGALIANMPAGGSFPSEIAFSPSGNIYYIGANIDVYDGALYPFSSPGNKPLFKIQAPAYIAGPKYPPPFPYLNMVFSPDSTRMYVANGTTVTVINTLSQKAIATLPVGYDGLGTPVAVAISPDGERVYALVNGVTDKNEVQVFNTANNALIQSIIIDGGSLSGLCISPDGANLYVTGGNNVAVVNTQTGKVTTYIPVGTSPEINTFCIKPGGCFGNPITFTITIKPAPVPSIITSIDSLNALTTVYGTPSPIESFTVSGELLRSGIAITAPPGFEISIDNNSFNSSLTLDGSGTIASTTVYVRLAAADAVGSYSGHIVLTSPGAGNVNIAIAKSTVTRASLIITADNKSKAYGAPNPVLTASYSGFENNDDVARLIYPPALNTTALISSPVGRYPITASGAYSPNYNIAYVGGILTITPDIVIPTAFTPNGDGVNDTWVIQKIGDYPNCTVQVFNRYGGVVYYSVGYGTPWDGNYRGARLPVGTYYYIINLNAGVSSLSGFVTLIR